MYELLKRQPSLSFIGLKSGIINSGDQQCRLFLRNHFLVPPALGSTNVSSMETTCIAYCPVHKYELSRDTLC